MGQKIATRSPISEGDFRYDSSNPAAQLSMSVDGKGYIISFRDNGRLEWGYWQNETWHHVFTVSNAITGTITKASGWTVGYETLVKIGNVVMFNATVYLHNKTEMKDGVVFATLPTGFRPTGQRRFPLNAVKNSFASAGEPGAIMIESSGACKVVLSGSGYAEGYFSAAFPTS